MIYRTNVTLFKNQRHFRTGNQLKYEYGKAMKQSYRREELIYVKNKINVDDISVYSETRIAPSANPHYLFLFLSLSIFQAAYITERRMKRACQSKRLFLIFPGSALLAS